MKQSWFGRAALTAVGLAVLLLVGYALRPEPVRVDVAIVQRGNLRVTVDEDGRTRLRERYRISAPLAGRLLRIQLDPGDTAGVGQLLAVIEPRDPSLLDPRERAEAQARVDAADAAVRQRAAQLERAEAELRLAANEAAKYTKMFAQGAATAKERDDAVLLEQVRHQQRNAARFAGQVASFRLELAQAALLHTAGARPGTPNGPGPSTGQPQRFHISAPCDGRVLRVFQESEGVVEAGTPLLEFGDPTDIEAVVDVLSSDAVAVRPGQDVLIEHWGGERPLRGRVRVVEPSGFTKVLLPRRRRAARQRHRRLRRPPRHAARARRRLPRRSPDRHLASDRRPARPHQRHVPPRRRMARVRRRRRARRNTRRPHRPPQRPMGARARRPNRIGRRHPPSLRQNRPRHPHRTPLKAQPPTNALLPTPTKTKKRPPSTQTPPPPTPQAPIKSYPVPSHS